MATHHMSFFQGCCGIGGRIQLEHPDDRLDWRQGSGDTIEIFDIQVYSEHRRQGKGRRLIDALQSLCKVKNIRRIWAITRAENFLAQKFYEEMRFVAVPLRNFYGVPTAEGRDTVDAIMYLRDFWSQA